MQKVIVPIDGSDASIRALEAALKLVKNTESAELHVLNIQSPIGSRNVSRFFSPETLNEYYQDEGEHALEKALALLENTDVKYVKRIAVGPIAETIQAYIEEHGGDHLIMGTRGLAAMPGLILGSVTTKVLSLINIPITLIK